MNIEQFAQLNISSEMYNFSVDFGEGLKIVLDYSKQVDSIKRKVEKDFKIYQDRIEMFTKIEGLRVGDYVKHKDGTYTRFTHKWDDGVQAGGGWGSYYMGKSGNVSYSGGLSSSIPYENLKETTETMEGAFWFPHMDYLTAGSGIYGLMQFKVFEEI